MNSKNIKEIIYAYFVFSQALYIFAVLFSLKTYFTLSSTAEVISTFFFIPSPIFTFLFLTRKNRSWWNFMLAYSLIAESYELLNSILEKNTPSALLNIFFVLLTLFMFWYIKEDYPLQLTTFKNKR